MNSYTAQIVFRIECNGQPTDQYEEQWRLVYAASEDQALTLARNIGAHEDTTFIDRHGRTMSWRMLAIKDIQLVEIGHGSLLFSMVREAETVAAPLWAAL